MIDVKYIIPTVYKLQNVSFLLCESCPELETKSIRLFLSICIYIGTLVFLFKIYSQPFKYCTSTHRKPLNDPAGDILIQSLAAKTSLRRTNINAE